MSLTSYRAAPPRGVSSRMRSGAYRPSAPPCPPPPALAELSPAGFGKWTFCRRTSRSRAGAWLRLFAGEHARERSGQNKRKCRAGRGNRRIPRPEGRRRHMLIETAQPPDGDVGEEEREECHAHHGGFDGGRRRAREQREPGGRLVGFS